MNQIRGAVAEHDSGGVGLPVLGEPVLKAARVRFGVVHDPVHCRFHRGPHLRRGTERIDAGAEVGDLAPVATEAAGDGKYVPAVIHRRQAPAVASAATPYSKTRSRGKLSGRSGSPRCALWLATPR